MKDQEMNNEKLILLIDDEVEMLKNRSLIIRKLGYKCVTLNDSREALKVIESEKPDLVLTDLKMPGLTGIDVLKLIKKINQEIIVIVFTGYATIQSAVEAIKLGAFDYIAKPFTVEQLKISLERALKFSNLSKENEILREQIKKISGLGNIVGASAAMKEIFDKIEKVSKTSANILIFGESGTGKELVARSIHTNSKRSHNAFIPIDCVALPPHLIESELFGYEKGAFTGATTMKHGLLEYAHQGTLFLDEICELSLDLQAKLLRVLQELQFRHIGGKDLIDVDIRIISATNIDPQTAIQQQKLREDLFYRLCVIPLLIPPLRERKEDIPLLVDHFLNKFIKENKFKNMDISREAMQSLISYSWPGNVRELQNLMERMVSLSDKPMVTIEDLPAEVVAADSRESSDFITSLPFVDAKKRIIENFEREYLMELLKRTRGNISKAAREAKLSRNSIYSLLNNYNISPASYK